MDNQTDWTRIADEICAVSNKDIVAYRDNTRYYEGLHEAELKPTTNNSSFKMTGCIS